MRGIYLGDCYDFVKPYLVRKPSLSGTAPRPRYPLMLGVRALMIGVLTIAPLGATAAQTPANTPKSRPNVILILTDDVGYGDLGSYGAPDVRTPHIDRLAREGVRFTDAYANGALCSPTRAALITGRYQQRVGIEWPLMGGDIARGVSGTGATLPALLKSSGYSTDLIGKWHLGTRPRWRADGRQLYCHTGDHVMVVDLKLGNTVEASRPRRLFVSPTMWSLDPAPDGKRFLTVMEDEASFHAPLNVVNWPATLLRSKP